MTIRRLGGALVLVVSLLANSQAQPAKTPAQAVLELTGSVAMGKEIGKEATRLAKQFGNPRVAMRLYNPRSRGGLGFGPRGSAMERRLVSLEEDGVTAEALKKESAEWTRIANVNLVVAEITREFAPAKPVLGRGKKEWEQDLETMKSGSRELLAAVKAGDAQAAQKAAGRLNQACNRCHDGAR